MQELERELRTCAHNGDLDRVRDLVEVQNVSVNCAGDTGVTPLMHAVQGAELQVARYLLDKGASLDAVEQKGRKAINFAIFSSSVPLLRLLVGYGADVDAGCYNDISPLAVAIKIGNVDMVASLLELGVKTHETLCLGHMLSALSVASMFEKAEIVQLMIAHNDGADVNKISVLDGCALTPLCVSCGKGSFEITKLLLQNGARVIYPGDSPNRCHPLEQAVLFGSLDLLQLLLGKVQETDPLDQLDMALYHALLDNKLEMATILVQHGANVNSHAVLCTCAVKGLCEGVRFLLQKDADANITNSHGQTPLWIAAERGNDEIVGLLLDANADTGIASSNGETPFAAAQRNEHVGVVYLLLRGAYDSVGRAELCGKSLFELITGDGKSKRSALEASCSVTESNWKRQRSL